MGRMSGLATAAPIATSTRIAVTGSGSVGPYGIDPEERWRLMSSGVSPEQPVTAFDASSFQCQTACHVRDFEDLAGQLIHERWLQVLPKSAVLAIVSTAVALDSAGVIERHPYTEFLVGTSSQSMEDVLAPMARAPVLLNAYSEPDIPPEILLRTFFTAPASGLAATFGTRGLAKAESTACASVFTAIESAMLRIAHSTAPAVVAVGVDTPVNLLTFSAFERSGMLSKSGVARPLDRRSDGCIFSEGSASFYIESLADATTRGAQPVAEVEAIFHGYDGRNMLHSADKSGETWAHFIRKALSGDLDIDAIILHAPGDPRIEALEFRALEAVFGARLKNIPVTSTKGAGSGLAYGGAAALEAALDMLAHQAILPTFNCDELRPEFLKYDVVLTLRPEKLGRILVNFRGFGGIAGAAVLRKIV